MKTFKRYLIESREYLWHISNEYFARFDSYMAGQGIIWFAKDKDDLIENLHGASINKNRPIWLYKVVVNTKYPAGWEEYEKYTLWELRDMGYDSIELDGDIAILDDRKINIINRVKLNNANV